MSAHNDRTHDIQAITGHACGLEHHERKLYKSVGEGLRHGQRHIGPLDLGLDQRDFVGEAQEEARDAVVYTHIQAELHARHGDKYAAALLRFTGRVFGALWMLLEETR